MLVICLGERCGSFYMYRFARGAFQFAAGEKRKAGGRHATSLQLPAVDGMQHQAGPDM